jgi:signal transduction histidine kinase
MSEAAPPIVNERNRLLTRLLAVTVVAASIHAIWDFFTVSPLVGIVDFLVALKLAVFLFLNIKGHHKVAQYGTLVFTTLVVLFFSTLVPRGIGVSLLFFPLISLIFIIIDFSNRIARYSLAATILVAYLALEVTEYRLFNHQFWLTQEEDRVSYVANFLTSGLLIYFSFNFLVKAHYRAEQKLRDMSAQISQQNAELKKANHELDRFVYSTSHDLRAPLRSIIGLLNLMDQQPDPKERQQFQNMIRNRIDTLDRFITDITLYSRNIRLAIVKKTIDLKNLAHEVVENHRYAEIAAPIDFKLHIPDGTVVSSDEQRLTTIFNNLVSNAIKYHNLNQASPWVILDAQRTDDTLLISVSDNGPGMPKEVKKNIFTMFYRGDERSEGSGLGLYIVQEVVEKLHGKIWVESELRKGSTFYVELPLEA